MSSLMTKIELVKLVSEFKPILKRKCEETVKEIYGLLMETISYSLK